MMLYAPTPVQSCFSLDLQQFSRLDARYVRPDLLALDPQALVQDSAALLRAHLTLHTPSAAFQGHPEGLTASRPVRIDHWRCALHLDEARPRHLSGAELAGAVQAEAGVVYTFRLQHGLTSAAHDALLLRQYALGDWFDQLELEFLLHSGLPGVDLLHGHALDNDGRLDAWSCEVRSLVH